MELELENFRCHDIKRVFIFPDKGLLLLKGPSGIGKSSILDAISFALYGSGNKVISFGQKRCRVSLKYLGFTITRTKGPNRLTLLDQENNIEYEDDAAQSIINDKFDVNFNITSYVTQKGLDTFFYLGTSERMAFLEKIALGDVDIADIKKKCKIKIKERKDKLNEKVGEYKVINEEFNNITEPTPIEFPLQGSYSDVKIKNESIRWKKNTSSLTKLRKELSELVEEFNKQKLLIQNKENLSSQLENIISQELQLEQEIKNLPPHETHKIESRIEFLKINKELTQTKTTLYSDNQQYQALCTIELSQLQDELDTLENINIIEDITDTLYNNMKSKERKLKLISKLDKIKEDLEEMDTEDNYVNAINELESQEHDLLQQKIKIKNRTTKYCCPKCNIFLKIGKKDLEIYQEENIVDKTEKEIDNELKTIRNEKSDYQDALKDLKRLNNDMTQYTKELEKFKDIDENVDYETNYNNHKEEIRDQEERLKRKQNLQRKINNKEFSATIQALKRKLEIKNDTVKKLEYSLNDLKTEDWGEYDSDNIDELQQTLLSVKLVKQKYEILCKQLKQLKNKKQLLEREISDIIIKDIDYQEVINDKNKELKDLETKDKDYSERNIKIQKYLEYKKEKDNYEKWKDKLKESKESEYNARLSLAVAEKMFKKIQETESAAVISIIDNINHHLRYYLEKFFVDPITVEISSFKETNNGDKKSNINIQVGYKGSESDINCLSGGERARVELAICLSINNIIGSKLLLLDECLSSLNTESIEDILEILKQEAKDHDKLIITILHQAPEAHFDEIVNID